MHTGNVGEEMELDPFTIIQCPNRACNQRLRVPTERGMLHVTCPKCRCDFDYNPQESASTYTPGTETRINPFDLGHVAFMVDGRESVESKTDFITKSILDCLERFKSTK